MTRGSSPHTRGALSGMKVVIGVIRIIPAYAGSTNMGAEMWKAAGDHPRIRGEHRSDPFSLCFPMGSSPHTRGARPGDGRRQGRLGIIPAYAGSTCRAPRQAAAAWDHPRIRGEHLMFPTTSPA